MSLNLRCVLTSVAMQRADALAIARGVSASDLMERAGAAVVDVICARYAPRPVLVLVGAGNNGGDGYVVARRLAEAGWPVEVLAVYPPAAGSLCEQMAQRFKGNRVQLVDGVAEQAALVVDAVFGTGLNRALEPEVSALFQTIVDRGIPVVAVDIPSGISGNHGQVCGAALAAVLTITFARKKRGHLLMPGKAYAGEVRVADIGISDDLIDQVSEGVYENHPDLWRQLIPFPTLFSHKYDRGAVAVVGGDVSVGAARLAALSALRVGAGLCTILASPMALPVYQSSAWSVMVKPLASDDLAPYLRDQRISAWAIGSGSGADMTTRQRVLEILAARRPVVLDADAISVFANDADALAEAIAAPAILTPHRGEFARLFGDAIPEGMRDQASLAAWAAHRLGATVVLKGADTVIAAPNGRMIINGDAPPWLATAGSGDVLAGLCVGLLAQGMPAFEAAAAAVWIHSQAAQRLGVGLIAEDLPQQIPAVLKALK